VLIMTESRRGPGLLDSLAADLRWIPFG